MPSLAIVRASNAKFSPKTTPVAVFVGGTSGIGEAIARAFACYTKGNAHIILCGRNRSAAEKIIASFPTPSAAHAGQGAKYEFVQCDATLMKSVQETTAGLLARLTKVNYLVMSPGILTTAGRTETKEGIDRKLALHYYARWKFAYDLLPLLRKARDAGEDAKVMSVLGAGSSTAKVNLDDIGLKKKYSLVAAASNAIGGNDLMVEVCMKTQSILLVLYYDIKHILTPCVSSLLQNANQTSPSRTSSPDSYARPSSTSAARAGR